MRVWFFWSPPSHLNFTTIIASYTLTCVSVSAGVDTVRTMHAEAGNHTVEGFRPATQYTCSVFASNSAGDGPTASIRLTTMDQSEP